MIKQFEEYRARVAENPNLAAESLAKRKRNPLARARATPKSLRLAITAKCWDCVGGGQDPDWRGAIRECDITDCPLWHVRPN